MVYSGSCLCGQTKIEVTGDVPADQINCHCTDCQVTSGSAHSVNILVPQKDVKKSRSHFPHPLLSSADFIPSFSTGAVKQYDSKAASGNTVSRIFCGECGSAMSHKSVAFGDAQALQTGIMHDIFKSVPIKTELFTKDRWSGIPEVPGAAQAKTMPEH